jgi:hypothetical protein
VVEYLATEPTPLRRAVLANPNVQDTIKGQIAKRARGYARRTIAHDIVEHGTLEHWLLLVTCSPGLPASSRVGPAG